MRLEKRLSVVNYEGIKKISKKRDHHCTQDIGIVTCKHCGNQGDLKLNFQDELEGVSFSYTYTCDKCNNKNVQCSCDRVQCEYCNLEASEDKGGVMTRLGCTTDELVYNPTTEEWEEGAFFEKGRPCPRCGRG